MKPSQIVVILMAIILAVGVRMYSESQALDVISTIIAVMIASQSRQIADYLGGKKNA